MAPLLIHCMVLGKCDFNRAINYLRYSWQHSTDTGATTILAINTQRDTHISEIFRPMTFPRFIRNARKYFPRASRPRILGSRFVPRSTLLSATCREQTLERSMWIYERSRGSQAVGINAITRKSIAGCAIHLMASSHSSFP